MAIKEERCTVCLKDLLKSSMRRRLNSETFQNPWRLTETSLSHANYLHFVWASTACSYEAAKEAVLNLLAMSTINLVTRSKRKLCHKLHAALIWLALPAFRQSQQHPVQSHQTLLPPSPPLSPRPTNRRRKGLGHARLHKTVRM